MTRPTPIALTLTLTLALSLSLSPNAITRADPPATQPTAPTDASSTLSIAPTPEDDKQLEQDYRAETSPLPGDRTFKDGVLTIRLPRADLWVQAEMGEIPAAAGVESDFYFYRCTCGKDKAVGQFALADYEVNDVLDALRAGGFDVVSISSMFINDKPRMMSLRFQAEGNAEQIARTLKSALDWTGDARTARQTSPDTQPSKPQPTPTSH